MKPGNIFIHHDGALGDTLLSLPCIDIIRESGSHIHMAGRRDVVHFLKEAGLVDEVSSADSRFYSSLYAESIDEPMETFLSGFDLSFVFTANTESQLLKNIRRVIPGTRAILTIPPESSPEHAAQFRLRQCGYREDAGHRKVALRIPNEDKIWAAEFLRAQGFAAGQSLITIHPGSGGKKKCWPPGNYAALINRVVRNPLLFCLLLSGPAEDTEAFRMLELLARTDKRIIHLRDAPLIRVAALLERSGCYIGNDSGISHLAGIMKKRGMVLFGPTDPLVWKPIGGTLEVLKFDEETETVVAGQIQMRVQELIGDS